MYEKAYTGEAGAIVFKTLKVLKTIAAASLVYVVYRRRGIFCMEKPLVKTKFGKFTKFMKFAKISRLRKILVFYCVVPSRNTSLKMSRTH